MTTLFNEKILESFDGIELVEIHKANILNSPVVAYHVRNGASVYPFPTGNHANAARSAAEQKFDDLTSADFYQHPAFLTGKR